MVKKTIIFLFLNSSIHAQSNLVSSGSNGVGNGGTFSSSIGQIDYISITSPGGTINSGNQVAFEIFTLGINEKILLELSVFPNPTTDYLILKIKEKDYSKLSINLKDQTGKLLFSSNIQSAEQKIDFKSFTSGNYFLTIIENNNELKSFKIIKNK
jgi:hypothetical protein